MSIQSIIQNAPKTRNSQFSGKQNILWGPETLSTPSVLSQAKPNPHHLLPVGFCQWLERRYPFSLFETPLRIPDCVEMACDAVWPCRSAGHRSHPLLFLLVVEVTRVAISSETEPPRHFNLPPSSTNDYSLHFRVAGLSNPAGRSGQQWKKHGGTWVGGRDIFSQEQINK